MKSLSALRAEAAGCKACDLWERATQTVFGEGGAKAKVMLVGEQPGNEEDVSGKPFVGPAGRLLDKALEEAGIDRSAAYVTNVVKHSSGSREESAVSTPSRTPPRSPPAGNGSTPKSRRCTHKFYAWERPPRRPCSAVSFE